MVPVGIKYIEEQRRTDRRYKNLSPLPDDWRYAILIGGEESSGLTTKGHVTDKDGVWANLLILDMLAYYGTRAEKPLKSLAEIWEETVSLPGCWKSFGGREGQGSNTGRTDVDAVLEVKEDLINYYLDCFAEGKTNRLAGLDVIYAGGVRYELVELRLRDETQDDKHFLRIRASGTEPINRIYVESSRPEAARQMMQNVLEKLVDLTIEKVRHAPSEWYLAEMLTVTAYSDRILQSVTEVLSSSTTWSRQSLVEKLETMADTPGFLEARYRRMTGRWIEAL
jgi:phosphomannomutase